MLPSCATSNAQAKIWLCCVLAYFVEWYIRQRLVPMLFDDHNKPAAEACRPSVVGKARRSRAAVTRQMTGIAADGLPVHSVRSSPAELVTLSSSVCTTDLQ